MTRRPLAVILQLIISGDGIQTNEAWTLSFTEMYTAEAHTFLFP